MCFEYIRPEKVSVLRADTIAIAHNNLDFRGRGDFFCQMTTGLFEQLLRQPESEMLDFKSSQYRFIRATDIEKSELLKDILAFSNAARQADAYILIGVEEVKGNRGIVRGANDHLNDSDLQQFVCSKTNRPPVFSYSAFEIDGSSCGVIRISDQTFDGSTVAVTKVSAAQIRPLSRNEIHQARPFELQEG
jgi:predicted HTH transcriptional regulator